MQSCTICKKEFRTNQAVTLHLRTHTGERPFRCDLCQKTFSQRTHLTSHMRLHTGERPFLCQVCPKRFTQSNNLKTHMKVHTGEKLYKCKVCGKRFALSQTLKGHMRMHTGEKPYKCKICQKDFAGSNSFTYHMKLHNRSSKLVDSSCLTCGKPLMWSAGSRHSYLKHCPEHRPIKPYFCEICGKDFGVANDLPDHMRTQHTGEKPFNCKQCTMSFCTSRRLYRHKMAAHHNHSRMCPFCAKLLATKKSMLNHIYSVHKQEKGFQCVFCGKNFSRWITFQHHVWNHIRESYYACGRKLCKKEFLTKGDLKKHEKNCKK